MIVAEAPGKLVLMGDYAVLAGAPGIAVAVGCRVRVSVRPVAGPVSRFVAGGPHGAVDFRWVRERGVHFETAAPPAFARTLSALAEVLAVRGLLDDAAQGPACEIIVDSSALYRDDSEGRRQKLGLGSSAAVTVALAGALRAWWGRPVPDDALLSLCHEAHGRLQVVAGSGVDIAAALVGGTLAVEFAASGAAPCPRPLAWPRGLHLVAVWSGRDAATPVLLSRLMKFRDQRPADHASHMVRLSAIATRGLAAWEAGDVPAFLSAVHTCDQGLRQLDAEAGIGICTPDHERLRGLALRHDAVYKTSGAGGGDFGLAFTGSAQVAARLRDDYAEAGYWCPDIAIGVRGLTIDNPASG